MKLADVFDPPGPAFGLAVVVLALFVVITWWLGMYFKHVDCIEALKDPGVGDVVRMALCKP